MTPKITKKLIKTSWVAAIIIIKTVKVRKEAKLFFFTNKPATRVGDEVSVQLHWPFISLVEHFLLNYFSLERNRIDKKKLMRFSGQFTLTVDCARQGTTYKYVVVKKGAVHWELLPEFPPRYYGAIVDRFLSIPKKYLKAGGK